ncbi:MAG: helix-turn-helix domain-containing protein [Gemmataceae bacterium]|nr:helix-turn-helix domain-containing protein [Gemmataceae bacterium]
MARRKTTGHGAGSRPEKPVLTVTYRGQAAADGMTEFVVRLDAGALRPLLAAWFGGSPGHGLAPVADTESDNVMTVPEAGKLLGLRSGGAYAMARRGEIPGLFNRGRRLYVWRPAFEQGMAELGRGRNRN